VREVGLTAALEEAAVLRLACCLHRARARWLDSQLNRTRGEARMTSNEKPYTVVVGIDYSEMSRQQGVGGN
jgi:hypothetical protein